MINDDLILHMDNINNGHYGHIQCMEGRYFDILSICMYIDIIIHMTGLLHEGKFHVGDLLEPAIFDSLPWAYVMCNWAQILIGDRH